MTCGVYEEIEEFIHNPPPPPPQMYSSAFEPPFSLLPRWVGGWVGGWDVPWQVFQVLHEVLLLHLKQLLVFPVHQGMVPEGAHVDTQHFGGFHHL